MLTGISILCFAACYAIAFGLEVVRLRRRPAWFHIPLAIATAAGLLAHSLFLINTGTATSALPISTADWLLWAAWVLAIVYFATIFYLPRTPTGLALLPASLIAGFMWDNIGPSAPFYYGSATALVSAVLMALLVKPKAAG